MDLCGTLLLKNDFGNTFCEIRPGSMIHRALQFTLRIACRCVLLDPKPTTPYTPNPKTHTPLHTPSPKPKPHTHYNLHPKLQDPDPTPQTPHPIPQTPNPKPQTPNPKPQTPNPKPQTPISRIQTPKQRAGGDNAVFLTLAKRQDACRTCTSRTSLSLSPFLSLSLPLPLSLSPPLSFSLSLTLALCGSLSRTLFAD